MRTSTDSLGPTLQALLADIGHQPWAWDFHQALRRIECASPGSPRFGTALRPADEPVRLGQEPSMGFAPASLSGLAQGQAGAPPRLEVRFFGLFGPNGPLPLHLTEYAHARQLQAADPTFARFADIIHHRFLSLFHRAWAQAQPCVSLDRPGDDSFGRYVGALAGLGQPGLRQQDALPDFAKLHHAALLNRQVRNAEGLSQIIAGFFRVPVVVEQFVGHWMPIRQRDHSRLGMVGNVLGRNALVGSRVWDRQHKFRLRVGPLDLAQYTEFLPGGRGVVQLRACVRNYVGLEYCWDAQLLLGADSVPPLRLGQSGRLGYTSWLGRRPGTAPAADLVLDVDRALRHVGERASALHPSEPSR
jgi:type VI secretion system protein ImpH